MSITLTEFQRLCCLSDSSLLCLLRENKLPCSYHPGTGLLIDEASVEIKNLVQAIGKRRENFLEENIEHISEQLENRLRETLLSWIDEA